MRNVSDKESEKLSVEIAGLESLDLHRLKARWKLRYEIEAPPTSEPGPAQASGCISDPGERAWWSQAGHPPTA